MADVIDFPGSTVGEIPVKNVLKRNVCHIQPRRRLSGILGNILQGAADKDLATAMVIGWAQDGSFYMATTDGLYKEMGHLLNTALHWVYRENPE